jgi:hypothetical protein
MRLAMTSRARGPAAALSAMLALAACNDDVVVRPVIDSPPGDTVFRDIETIEMSVAIDGETESLASLVFRRGETLELPGVPYGANLVIHMSGRVNNAEVAYGRTCRFAVNAGEPPPSPHLYFARTVRWAEAPIPPNPVRIGGAALTSRNGSALYLSGRDQDDNVIAGMDRFDPVTGQFEQLANLPPRLGGAVANLGDGRAIVLGGTELDGRVSIHIDVISSDASSDQVLDHEVAPQLGAPTAPALTTLSDGRVVAIGGLDAAGMPIKYVAEIASDGGGLLIRQFTETVLATPRHGHTATPLSNDFGAPVLIAGGRDAAGAAVQPSELYRPLVGEVAPPAEFAEAMQVPRWDHAAVRLPDGSVLIIGGRNASGPVASLEVFTRETGFIVQGFLPLGTGLTDFSVTTLPDGRILIAGGRDATGEAVDAASIVRIDPIGGGIDIVNTDRLATKRAGHVATLLCDGTVLLAGGTTVPTPAERYNPPSSGRR